MNISVPTTQRKKKSTVFREYTAKIHCCKRIMYFKTNFEHIKTVKINKFTALISYLITLFIYCKAMNRRWNENFRIQNKVNIQHVTEIMRR